MAKKKKTKAEELETLRAKIKEKTHLKAVLQRRVPVLIKNDNLVDLENVYKQIEKMTIEIFTMERKRANLNGKEKEEG